MFADELAGNPAKKRADEARARRLRAKREKQAKQRRHEEEKKKASASTIASYATQNATSISESKDAKAVFDQAQENRNAALNITSGGDEKSAAAIAESLAAPELKSAAEKAAEQRKLRAEQRVATRAAVTIQSIIRSKQTAKIVRREQRAIFDKRIGDLVALSNILKSKSNQEYVAPQATATTMVAQFLFFAVPTLRDSALASDMILLGDDLSRWAQLVKYLLLPGVCGNNNIDLDPILPWMESLAGSRRFEKILTLCVKNIAFDHGKANRTKNSCCAIANSFMRAILRLDGNTYTGGGRDRVYKRSCSLLLPASATDSKNCDLFLSLRATLFFGPSLNSSPIPVDADRLHFSADRRERAGTLVKLVLDLISSLETSGAELMAICRLSSRFLVEILTVPLFSLKVISSSYDCLVREGRHGPSPLLVRYIRRFLSCNGDNLLDGGMETVLYNPDVSLNECNATPVLCLLGTLVQLGRASSALNGKSPSEIQYKPAAEYYNFLALLINAAPLGTFSSRMSAVEWVYNGSSSTPIVLSSAVIDQVSAIISASTVRGLFNCAIDNDALGTKTTLGNKTSKDKKHEQDLEELGSTSAANVAAKEAMTDRTNSIWRSGWAKKLQSLISGSGSSGIAKPTKIPSLSNGAGKLLNTSSISRQLANGKGPVDRTVTNAVMASEESNKTASELNHSAPRQDYSITLFFALCRVYCSILSRWGGYGKHDLVNRPLPEKQDKDHASATTEKCVTALLNVLCFSTSLLETAWAVVQSNPRVVSDLYAVIDVRKRGEAIRTLSSDPLYNRSVHTLGEAEGNVGAVILYIFTACLCHTLIVTDDVEIHDMEKPLPKHQLRRLILLQKKLLYRACCLDDVHEGTSKSQSVTSNSFGVALIAISANAMSDLYSRSSRRLLCSPKLWIEEDLLEKDMKRCKTHQDFISLLSVPICRICPFLVSYKCRLKLFERIVTTNRTEIQGSNELRNLRPGIMCTVNRSRVLEDGLAHLNKLGRDLRQRIVVSYLSEVGARETGVDVGGLFKEFWTDLSALAFNPDYALFKIAEGSPNMSMYPNPLSKLAHGQDHVVLFEFLGRILGKALYEGITIQPQFAHLFLSFLRGDHSYLHLLTDLSTIDTTLYNNLMFLKTYKGDVNDLCLNFTVSTDDFGVRGSEAEVPLVEDGVNVAVTNENKRSYIYLMAKYHCSDRIKEQSSAFTRGLWDVIDRSWLRLFNEPELQVLISGASDGRIDVADMKSHARYTGGYTMLDRNIVRFWSVVNKMSPKHQADLLRFVTSCERPPPLGFSSMNPPFTVQRIGIMRDGEKLPSASTCFNTLKLPTYSSEKVLRERLIYAIESGAGFELT